MAVLTAVSWRGQAIERQGPTSEADSNNTTTSYKRYIRYLASRIVVERQRNNDFGTR
jgi:hypothetical protein